jgi:non-homologous end joining protein Ku
VKSDKPVEVAPVEEKTVREVKVSEKVNNLHKDAEDYIVLRNQFAVAVADYVLKGMDITFLDGHASIPRMAEKVYMLADALTKESLK